MLAPIVLFVYKRLSHTRETLEAINRNHLADESELFIFSDAASTDENQKAVADVRSYIKDFSQNSNFKQVHIMNAEEHKGLSRSIISGVTQVINRFGKVIVLEDDIVTAHGFLKYMNQALDFYEENEMIWSISGCAFPLKALDDYSYDVYLNYRTSSWSWASWKNRWDRMDWDVSDFAEFKKDKKRIKEFCKGGEDLFQMLCRQMNGEIDSWAIRWCYQQYKEGMFTIYPRESFIVNIGFDGSGTHGKAAYEFASLRIERDYEFVHPELSLALMEEARKFNSVAIVQKIKNRLLRIVNDR